MSGSIQGTLSETEVYQFYQQTDQIVFSPTEIVQPNQFNYWAGFDGTNNEADKLNISNSERPTTIYTISEQIKNASTNNNQVVGYFPGPGTTDSLPGSSFMPWQVTQEAVQTAYTAYNDFAVKAAAWLKQEGNENGSISTMVAGFSRGGAASAIFLQLVDTKGLIDPSDPTNILIEPGSVDIANVMLIDPVLTGNLGNMGFPPSAKNVTVLRALDELRTLFPYADYDDLRVNVIEIFGNHGDLGGMYDDNGIGALVLEKITEFYKKSNLSIDDVDDLEKRGQIYFLA